jgi:predicted kinase
MSQRPIIHLFLGVPGSGKSYFARQLADQTNTVRINSDAMRLAIFGSLEAITAVYHSPDRQHVNTYVDGATQYVVAELLDRGHSVVCDAHHNKRSDREAYETLAGQHDARVVLVWIQTPFNVALTRGQQREAKADQRQLSEQDMREVMERHKAAMDEPAKTENVIIIDGEQPFDQQYASYQEQIGKLPAPTPS